MLLTPSPSVTDCHTFSDPLPLKCDVLYGRPLFVLPSISPNTTSFTSLLLSSILQMCPNKFNFLSLILSSSRPKCSKLGHYTGFCKSNREPVQTGVVSSLQFLCFFIIRTKICMVNKNMLPSVENFLIRSYPRIEYTTCTTTTTAIV